MTILERLLDELQAAKGPISSADLARRLDVSEPTLDGMVSVLVDTGRLAGDQPHGDTFACSGLACGSKCVGLDDCAFIVSVPTIVRLLTT